MRALACLLLLPALALAQASKPDKPNEPDAKPGKPDKPDPATEARLKRETGSLTLKLVAVHSEPQQETSRLTIEVFRRGSLVDRKRTLDVSRVRRKDGFDLRIRFRDPPKLRRLAGLIRVRRGKATVYHRYDPVRRKSERRPPPVWSQRLAGTGLTWGDLRGERFQAHRYVYEADAVLQVPALPPSPPGTPPPPPTPIAVRRVSATATGPNQPNRILHVDRKRHVPILIRTLDAQGKTTRLVWAGRHKTVGKKLRPFLLVVEEPGAKRTSVIRVERRASKVPAAHLDPSRYHQE